jgi:hypothetical protein
MRILGFHRFASPSGEKLVDEVCTLVVISPPLGTTDA